MREKLSWAWAARLRLCVQSLAAFLAASLAASACLLSCSPQETNVCRVCFASMSFHIPAEAAIDAAESD